MLNFILLGLAVFRLSILIGLADNNRRIHHLRKFNKVFMSPAGLSIWFGLIGICADYFLHDALIFKLAVGAFALSGFACVLANPGMIMMSRMANAPRSTPQSVDVPTQH